MRVVLNGTDLGTVTFANNDHPAEVFAQSAAAVLHNGDNIVGVYFAQQSRGRKPG